jgi:hypothetical protein
VFTLGPTTQARLVKVKPRRIWREWDGKKKSKKSPIFFPKTKVRNHVE